MIPEKNVSDITVRGSERRLEVVIADTWKSLILHEDFVFLRVSVGPLHGHIGTDGQIIDVRPVNVKPTNTRR